MSQEPKKRSQAMQRVITGTLLTAVLALALWVGGWLFAILAFLALSLALYEELSALRACGHRPVWWVSFVGLAASAPLMMTYSSLSLVPILTVLLFAVMLQVMRRPDPDLVDIEMSALPLLSVLLPGMCLFGLLGTQPRCLQAMLMVMVFTVAVGGDTLAYLVGSLVGGPKLCPSISPNKTVAGAVGGLLGSVVCTALTGAIFSWCLPSFDGFPPLWANVLVGLFGGVAAQMGDLFASLVKRHCKVKDFGHIFPGHGGMLDRMDSVVFAAVVLYCYRVILAG
ncbi:MAG TPA: CDP-archaeol synthase [Candidatus Limiplasma stercoravium]|nr:CDP-archaeol synthase [Candidatus Limiplasma stercoravium]